MSRESASLCTPLRITSSWRDSGQRARLGRESRHLPRQNGATVGTAPDGDVDARAKDVSGNESGNGCRILGTTPSAGTATFRLGCA